MMHEQCPQYDVQPFSKPDGVDAPAWSEDAATQGYISTCQGTKAGDPLHTERIEAEAASGKIVEHGLKRKRLAVKFLFRPGSTAFGADARLTGPYPMRLKAIAARASTGSSCLEITGHTSATGPEPLNERLSVRRAEYV